MMGFLEIFSTVVMFLIAVYGTVIILFTSGLLKLQKRISVPNDQPPGFVSVIIPVRNEAANIGLLLEEMVAQDFQREQMEVIVTDDFSEDDTMILAGRFAAIHPGFPLKMIIPSPGLTNPHGKKSAIERAIEGAKGDILLFTDGDTGHGPGWISSMVNAFRSPGIRMVLGPVCFSGEKNLLQKLQSLEFLGLMGATAGSASLGYPVMCNGANLAYRRGAFFQAGGFSGNRKYSSGDDQFIMSAVRKRYGKGSVAFNFDPGSSVSTGAEATLAGFLNQRMRWVSKSRGYRDPAVIGVGVLTYLVHLLLLAGMVCGMFYTQLLPLFLGLWLVKILLEYPMVFIMAGLFGKKRPAGYYLAAQVFQLVYVPLAGMLGLFLPYRWKGRKI